MLAAQRDVVEHVFAVTKVTADDHVLGRADAPVTVLEYGDYECPYCRGAARDVHEMLGRYPEHGPVRVPELPHRPVASACGAGRRGSQRAAGARGNSGKCVESGCCSPRPVSTWTPCWTAPRTWAWTSAGFRDEVLGHAYAAKIERDVQEGVRDGVNATPKFYVDGERIDGKLPLEGLEDAIRAAVRAVSGASGA